jgi:uncharacterized Ntn-hydrolase superfamily protein
VVEPAYGPRGLGQLRRGASAPDALRRLLGDDEQADVRQVAMLDNHGRVAVHTGRRCIAEAGHRVADGVSAQANMMERSTVPAAMIDAYRSADGDLSMRLLAALEAAEREGGDIRGRQSAAILVVSATNTGRPWVDRVFDLRVEDSANPVAELRRLVGLKRAYDRMNRGDELFATKDVEGALGEYSAAERAVPDNVEMIFWHAVTLANAGRADEALPLLKRVYAADRNWAELLKRLPKAGLLPDDAKLLERLLNP